MKKKRDLEDQFMKVNINKHNLQKKGTEIMRRNN